MATVSAIVITMNGIAAVSSVGAAFMIIIEIAAERIAHDPKLADLLIMATLTTLFSGFMLGITVSS